MAEQEASYPVSDDEEERLQTLRNYEILDTSPEPAFDNLTTLASEIFDVPIVLVCLLDEDRQWFKSCTGIKFQQTERECAFCNYVLLQEDVLVIENTLEDERVKENRLVLDEPEIRSYAGAPLKSNEGQILGTFCLLGLEPRTYTKNELIMLKRFAHEAITQIELRYGNEHQRRINEQLNEERENLIRKIKRRELEQDELIHRVKNDLNQILSLLRIQRNDFLQEASNEVLKTAEARIHCFLSIYRKLNEAKKTETLNIRDYLEDILDNLTKIFKDECGNVTVSRSIEDVNLSSSTGLILGLALNELVTNAYQHVFMKDIGDRLRVEFQVYDDFYELIVTDNGPGMIESNQEQDIKKNGLGVLRALIESEQNASIREDYTDGSRFEIRLAKE